MLTPQNGEDRARTPPENPGNSQFSAEGAANSGAVADVGGLAAELARIVAVWPLLSAPIRRAMLALVDSANDSASGGPEGLRGLAKTLDCGTNLRLVGSIPPPQ